MAGKRDKTNQILLAVALMLAVAMFGFMAIVMFYSSRFTMVQGGTPNPPPTPVAVVQESGGPQNSGAVYPTNPQPQPGEASQPGEWETPPTAIDTIPDNDITEVRISSEDAAASYTAMLADGTLTPEEMRRLGLMNENADPNAPATIWGFVTTDEGQPIVNAYVLAEGTAEAAYTDERGHYRLANLRPGEVTIAVRPPRHEQYIEPKPNTMTLYPGAEVGGVNFVLFAEGDFIAGYVRDYAGEPIEGAEVSANLGRGTWTSNFAVQTDNRGYFRIEGVVPGKAIPWLRVIHPEYEAETRMNVTAWDGEQIFVLNKVSDLTLRVTWAFDGSPVTLYGYRLLKRGFNDFDYDVGRAQVLVDDAQGRTALDDVETGHWRVEVTVLGEQNAVSDIRGSVDFEIATGGENREINVQITAGRMLSGVVIDPDGKLVAGAEVEIVPPPRIDGTYIQNRGGNYSDSAALQFPKTQTNEAGYFEYQGMPPGRYTVYVTKDSFLAPAPVDVDIVAERDPEPLQIKLSAGGVIYGRVIGPDGEPMSNVRLMRAQSGINEYQWKWEEQTTDPDGYYRYEGLRWGIHWVYIYTNRVREERRNVDLAAGQEYELNFDFSESVELSGTVFVGSDRARGGNIRFLRDDRSDTGWNEILPDGTYKVSLKPGTYWPGVSLFGERTGELPTSIEVREQPPVQTQDIYVELADVDVLLVYPPDAEFERGQVVINPRDMKTVYGFNRLDMTQEFKRAPGLVAGEYMATYTSRSRTWEGDSGWVQIKAGQENTIVIEVKKRARGARVGGWGPDQVATTGTTLSFDISSMITSKSDVSALVTYEKGRYAVAIEEVAITANGSVIWRDRHRGWSGSDHWANTYRLNVPNYAANTRYELKVTLATDGGTDSTGSVYIEVY